MISLTDEEKAFESTKRFRKVIQKMLKCKTHYKRDDNR